ncbi:MAG: Rrf2 family transcriptional regulator [Ginsengibacter sp.]|jgi:Rrf2 family protein
MFSKSTEYALRATIYIAQKGSIDKRIGIEEVSKAIGSPRSFTAKILQTLTKDNKIISSVSGPHGGFYLTEKNKNLPVRSILEVMGEDELFDRCVLGLDRCSEVKPCPMHFKYKIIRRQLSDLFEKETILHLANDINAGDVFLQ